jgi:hypothetical protein
MHYEALASQDHRFDLNAPARCCRVRLVPLSSIGSLCRTKKL